MSERAFLSPSCDSALQGLISNCINSANNYFNFIINLKIGQHMALGGSLAMRRSVSWGTTLVWTEMSVIIMPRTCASQSLFLFISANSLLQPHCPREQRGTSSAQSACRLLFSMLHMWFSAEIDSENDPYGYIDFIQAITALIVSPQFQYLGLERQYYILSRGFEWNILKTTGNKMFPSGITLVTWWNFQIICIMVSFL